MEGLLGQDHPTEPQMANLTQLGVRETTAHTQAKAELEANIRP